jgi:hypothetical protein
MIRVSRRTVRLAIVVLVLAIGLVVLARSGVAAAVLEPRAVATAADTDKQRAATERAIQRAQAAAVDQLRRSRALKLPITDTQAAAIEASNLADLRSLRHSALVSVAQALGQSAADAEAYAKTTEQRLDASPVPEKLLNESVLLAPKLFAIVQRMDEVSAQIADRGTRAMTVAPSASPRPSGAP